MSTWNNMRIHEIERIPLPTMPTWYKMYMLVCVDNKFRVYINNFFSCYGVCYGLTDITLAKLGQGRSVWGSLLNTYPQSLLHLKCRRRIITKCTVLEKDDTCCGDSEWNHSRCAVSLGMSMHMPLGFVRISYKLNLNFYYRITYHF